MVKRIGLVLLLGSLLTMPTVAFGQGFNSLEDISGLPPQDVSVTPATTTPSTTNVPATPTPAPATVPAQTPTGPRTSLLFIASLISGGFLFVLLKTYSYHRKTRL